MVLTLLTLALMLAVAGIYFREGLFRAFLLCCQVLAAGLVAFNFYEPLAGALEHACEGSFLEGAPDALSLIFLFALTLVGLCLAANRLLPKRIEYPWWAQRAGGILFGLLAGYLAAGFLVCVLQTLPLPEHFLGFEWRSVPDEPPLRALFPPDRAWLGLMRQAAAGPLSRGKVPGAFNTFEERYADFRRGPRR